MDEIDFATERAEAFIKVALQAALTRNAESERSDGVCKSCREPIESERLGANANARLCSECAAEEEASRQRARRCGPR